MIKIGIIGCGNIARKMASTINGMEDAELVACASRDIVKARAFAEKYSIRKAFGSYEELYDDNEVELVYIATPMSVHKKHMLGCIRHGKNVLCEKSFTVNAEEAEEVFEEAKANNVYVAEAIWTRYMPVRKYIADIIESGEYGSVTSISANLSYQISEKERIKEATLGGGAMLDIGVYPLNFAFMFLPGQDVEFQAGTCIKNEKGVDIKDSMSIATDKGVNISLYADATTFSDRRGCIMMEGGMIEVENINDPESVTIWKIDEGKRGYEFVSKKEFSHEIDGFQYEVEEACRCILTGRKENSFMPWKETLRMMRIMDRFRSAWGVRLGSEL